MSDTTQEGASRARRKTRTGVVTSDKMAKTVTVDIVRRLAHPIYGKQVTRTTRTTARTELGAHHGDPADRADGVLAGGGDRRAGEIGSRGTHDSAGDDPPDR